jgi:hypothetical protein
MEGTESGAKPREGVLSIFLLVNLLVGGAGGTVIGLALGGLITNGDVLAIITAFLAVLLGMIARTILGRVLPRAPVIPPVVLASSLVVSLIAGLAGHELSVITGYASSPALIGLFSGLLATILMDVLIIVYHARIAPDPSRHD